MVSREDEKCRSGSNVQKLMYASVQLTTTEESHKRTNGQ